MPVPPTKDNPHGWGYIEKRTVLEHYQLSPRIKIVIGDIIKIGKWKVHGIFEGKDGIEMSVVHCWPGGLSGSTSTIRVTGDEYPSPIVDIIIRRPHKIRLAKPRHRRKKRVG